jgi:hypothetical protein
MRSETKSRTTQAPAAVDMETEFIARGLRRARRSAAFASRDQRHAVQPLPRHQVLVRLNEQRTKTLQLVSISARHPHAVSAIDLLCHQLKSTRAIIQCLIALFAQSVSVDRR